MCIGAQKDTKEHTNAQFYTYKISAEEHPGARKDGDCRERSWCLDKQTEATAFTVSSLYFLNFELV